MSKKKENIEFINQNKEQKELKVNILKEVLSGSLIVKKTLLEQLPFVFFLTFIAVIYIGNRYHAERIYRRTVTLQNEIKELRSESITTASELMNLSKQSEVTKMIQEKGLEVKESVIPPVKIKLER